MNGLMGEVVEKATNNPNSRKMMMGGISHHFLFCQIKLKISLYIDAPI
jgi:hypothetical protein